MINKTNSKRDVACRLWVRSVSQCPIDPSAGQLTSADIGSQIADSSPVGYLIANRTVHCDPKTPPGRPHVHAGDSDDRWWWWWRREGKEGEGAAAELPFFGAAATAR